MADPALFTTDPLKIQRRPQRRLPPRSLREEGKGVANPPLEITIIVDGLVRC